MLEGIFKGLTQWLFDLILEIVEYISNSLLDVFGMNPAYLESEVPIIASISQIILAVGWALLLGNLVFQAIRSMTAGLGFEGEDPKLLFTRTFLFSFLLVASRQICDIGLGITATVIDMLQVPSSVNIPIPKESAFSIGASWLLVILIGLIVMWQVIRLFFEVGERYVITSILTIFSPLAFAMGGSKSTEDIFKGWVRMFASMCLMMVFNVVFLKMMTSVLSKMPSGADVLPWMILVMGIARVARKIDSIVARIGLNPAITGDGLGRSMPGMLAFSVVRSLGSTVTRTIGRNGGNAAKAGSAGKVPPGGTGGGSGRPVGSRGLGGQRPGTAASQQSNAASGTNSQQNHTTADTTGKQTVTPPPVNPTGSVHNTAGTQHGPHAAAAAHNATQTASQAAAGGQRSASGPAAGPGRQTTRRTSVAPMQGRPQPHRPGAAFGIQNPAGTVGTTPSAAGNTHIKPGTAKAGNTRFTAVPSTARQESHFGMDHPAGQKPSQLTQIPASGTAGTKEAFGVVEAGNSRYSSAPPASRPECNPGTGVGAAQNQVSRQTHVGTKQNDTQTAAAAHITDSATSTLSTTQRGRPMVPPGTAGTAGNVSADRPQPRARPIPGDRSLPSSRPSSNAPQGKPPAPTGVADHTTLGRPASPEASSAQRPVPPQRPSPAQQERGTAPGVNTVRSAGDAPSGAAGTARTAAPQQRPNHPGRPPAAQATMQGKQPGAGVKASPPKSGPDRPKRGDTKRGT